MRGLENKVALVTASTRGIGWACVERLAKEGAVVYMASTEKEIKVVRRKVEKLCKTGLDIRPIVYDAFDADTYKPMIDTILEAGGLDIIVNNFGYTNVEKDLSISEISYENFEKIVNANLKSVILPIQYAFPYMKEHGGSIINIASVAAHFTTPTELAYGTAKSSICYLTKMAAAQMAQYQIRCNAVLPGMTATDSVRYLMSQEKQDKFVRHIPLGRMMEPEEISAAVAYFASDESTMTTGQLLEVAGGYGIAGPTFEYENAE